MKTDTELEALLRETFAGRADTLHDARPWQPPAHAAQPARRWLPVLAAAMAVAIVAAGVALGVHFRHSNKPAHPKPTPTTSSLPAPATLHALRCTVPVPEAWRGAIAAGTVSIAGRKLIPLAVTDAGDVLADEAAAVALPHTHKLVLVTRAGTVRTLYGKQPPASWNGMRIGDVSTEAGWAAFGLLVQAQSGGQGPVQIELVNLSTGAQRTLRPTAPNDVTIVLGPALADGAVYWIEMDNGQGLQTGRVYRYDISTGRRAQVDHGVVFGPLSSDGRVYWLNKDIVEQGRTPSSLPAGFDLAAAVREDAPLLVDGPTYAWLDTATMSSIKAATGGAGPITAVPADHGGRPTGLTGDLLWWGDAVLDLGTGAAVDVGDLVLARGHTAAAELSGGRITVFDTSGLPPLHC